MTSVFDPERTYPSAITAAVVVGDAKVRPNALRFAVILGLWFLYESLTCKNILVIFYGGANSMKKLILLASAALLVSGLIGTTPASAATLIGDSISASYGFPDTGTFPTGFVNYSPSTFTVVDPGVESVLSITSNLHPATPDIINVDFSAYALTFTFLNAESRTVGTFNGPEFTVLSGNPFGAIDSVVISGGQAVSASIVGGVLEVNWQGQTFAAADTVVINFASPVPEPSTWAMMLLGFAGLGFMAYRRRDNAMLAA